MLVWCTLYLWWRYYYLFYLYSVKKGGGLVAVEGKVVLEAVVPPDQHQVRVDILQEDTHLGVDIPGTTTFRGVPQEHLMTPQQI